MNHEEATRRTAEPLARKRLCLVGSTPLIRTTLTATRATSQAKAKRKQLPAVQLLNSWLSAARPTILVLSTVSSCTHVSLFLVHFACESYFGLYLRSPKRFERLTVWLSWRVFAEDPRQRR